MNLIINQRFRIRINYSKIIKDKLQHLKEIKIRIKKNNKK